MPKTREELIAMYDAGDLYGLFLMASRNWLAKYHPEAQSAATIVDFGREQPMLHMPIIPCESAAAERLVARTPVQDPR